MYFMRPVLSLQENVKKECCIKEILILKIPRISNFHLFFPFKIILYALYMHACMHTYIYGISQTNVILTVIRNKNNENELKNWHCAH